MLQKLLFKVVQVLFALLPLTGNAQEPDFSGTWILNLEKSKLEHLSDGFTGSIFIIEQDDDQLRLTRYHLYGEKKNKISFRMTADGETRRVKLFFNGKLEKNDAGLQATLWRKNFHNVVQYQFGAHEHELIADEVFTGLPENHHNIWVFDKAVNK
jgi:hypothetical protein